MNQVYLIFLLIFLIVYIACASLVFILHFNIKKFKPFHGFNERKMLLALLIGLAILFIITLLVFILFFSVLNQK